jgi:aryl-alcohol dehydrogenase
MQIEAAVVRDFSVPWTLERLELEPPRADEVLVRLVASGICHTDVKLSTGRFPAPCVLGHEGAGVVESVGSDIGHVAPGDHVVLSWDSCGTCRRCASGHPSYCDNFAALNFGGGRMDGATALSDTAGPIHSHFFGQSSFATYAVVHERCTIRVAEDLPLQVLAPLGCGALTGACAVFRSLSPAPGSTFGVFGSGAVGLSAVMAARLVGCSSIVAVDVVPERLELARELGATHVIDAREGDVPGQILEAVPHGLEYALDTTGVAPVVLEACRSLDTLGVLGFVAGPQVESMSLAQLQFGRSLRGIIEGDSVPSIDIPKLIDYWRAGCPIDRLNSYFDFADFSAAFEAAVQGRAIKPVVRFTS